MSGCADRANTADDSGQEVTLHGNGLNELFSGNWLVAFLLEFVIVFILWSPQGELLALGN